MWVVNAYREPEADSSRFAYLTKGSYATVIKLSVNDWYLMDASTAIDSIEPIAVQGEGWVNARGIGNLLLPKPLLLFYTSV